MVKTPEPPEVDYLSTPEGQREGIEMLEREPYGLLAKEYMKRFITDRHNNIDHTYGPRMVENNIMIGDGSLEFDNKNLYIKEQRYTGTQGLYELILGPFLLRLSHTNRNTILTNKLILIMVENTVILHDYYLREAEKWD